MRENDDSQDESKQRTKRIYPSQSKREKLGASAQPFCVALGAGWGLISLIRVLFSLYSQSGVCLNLISELMFNAFSKNVFMKTLLQKAFSFSMNTVCVNR